MIVHFWLIQFMNQMIKTNISELLNIYNQSPMMFDLLRFTCSLFFWTVGFVLKWYMYNWPIWGIVQLVWLLGQEHIFLVKKIWNTHSRISLPTQIVSISLT